MGRREMGKGSIVNSNNSGGVGTHGVLTSSGTGGVSGMVSNHITTWPSTTSIGTGQWYPGQLVQQWPHPPAPTPGSWAVVKVGDYSKQLVRAMEYKAHPTDPSRLREFDGGVKHHPTHLWLIFDWDMPYPSYDALRLCKSMLNYWVKRSIDDESGSAGIMRRAMMPNTNPLLNDPIAERKASEEYFRIQIEMMQSQRELAEKEAEHRKKQQEYEKLLRLNNSVDFLKPEDGFWHRILTGIGIK